MKRPVLIAAAAAALLGALALGWFAMGWYGSANVEKDTTFIVPDGASLTAVGAKLDVALLRQQLQRFAHR